MGNLIHMILPLSSHLLLHLSRYLLLGPPTQPQLTMIFHLPLTAMLEVVLEVATTMFNLEHHLLLIGYHLLLLLQVELNPLIMPVLPLLPIGFLLRRIKGIPFVPLKPTTVMPHLLPIGYHLRPKTAVMEMTWKSPAGFHPLTKISPIEMVITGEMRTMEGLQISLVDRDKDLYRIGFHHRLQMATLPTIFHPGLIRITILAHLLILAHLPTLTRLPTLARLRTNHQMA